MIKKKCFKCGEIKSINDFYYHYAMADKHLNKCKKCCKEFAKLNRIEHSEKFRLYERTRNRGKKAALRAKEWRKKYPEKYKAQNLINNALKNKKLTKPDKCEICNSNFHIHGHHNDYSKPLEVIWICAKCHSQIQ